MTGFTDIHQHFLWGIDDGARDEETMREMLRECARQNVRRICATPHACPGFEPFDMDLYRERLNQARNFCASEGLGINIMSGAEIAWTYQTVEALRRGSVPTLNGTEYALIELWHDISWQEVREAARQIMGAGFVPIFAHVERYSCFVWQPGRALDLRHELPALYQVNASTILKPGGPVMKNFVRRMLLEEGFDAVASDAHDMEFRPQRLESAWKTLREKCGEEYAAALVNFDGVIR